MAELSIRQLTKVFPAPGGGVTALDGVSLDIGHGECVALLGPSGCGKTTLLRVIAGLEKPTNGVVVIAGRDQQNIPPGDRNVAMVFQNLALYPHMTVRENLEFGLKLRKMPRAAIETQANEIARLLGITDCLTRRPAELSGGQRQRVAIGRALVRRPDVLLLDEPFANLDAPLRRELRREMQRLHRELNLTIILVTHDQSEALALGQRVAVMNTGRMEQVDTAAGLLDCPATPFIRDFLNLGAL